MNIYYRTVLTLFLASTNIFAASDLPSPEDFLRTLMQAMVSARSAAISSDEGSQALLAAVTSNNISKAEQLMLQDGVKPRGKHLHLAIHKSPDTQMASALIKHGAPIGERAGKGFTPLIGACAFQRLPFVELLCSSQAPLDSIDEMGNTALHTAAFLNNAPITECLLRHGAFPNPRNNLDFTPLHLAAMNNSAVAISLLLNYADANLQDPFGYTPLLLALKMKREAAALIFIEKKSSIETPSSRKKMPMHMAAKHGVLGVLRALLACNAPCDAQDNHERTPVVLALLKKQFAAALFLTEAGVDIEKPNHKGNTPLHIAAAYGATEVVDALVGRGAQLSVKNKAGKYPYEIAQTPALRTKLTPIA